MEMLMSYKKTVLWNGGTDLVLKNIHSNGFNCKVRAGEQCLLARFYHTPKEDKYPEAPLDGLGAFKLMISPSGPIKIN